MPTRITPLITNEFYHILNRGSGSIPIFKTTYDYKKFIQIFLYYQNTSITLKYSKFITLPSQQRNQLMEEFMTKRDFLVEIIAYCLMPNHFHLILKQQKDKGILDFIRLVSSSYSHYFNIKYERKGGLFEGRFQAIRIETEEQLLHLNRYIHLNPYSSYLVKDLKSLIKYPFSSFSEYLSYSKEKICQKEIILSQFKNVKEYEKFIFDQADYQRKLEVIKHQILE